jgi:hypothetical protein
MHDRIVSRRFSDIEGAIAKLKQALVSWEAEHEEEVERLRDALSAQQSTPLAPLSPEQWQRVEDIRTTEKANEEFLRSRGRLHESLPDGSPMPAPALALVEVEDLWATRRYGVVKPYQHAFSAGTFVHFLDGQVDRVFWHSLQLPTDPVQREVLSGRFEKLTLVESIR